MRIAVGIRLLPKLIILASDGGICSQMHFYLIGRILEASGNQVEYDLKWFEKCGKDLDGRFERNYDLEKLFPALHPSICRSSLLRRLYITAFHHRNNYEDTTQEEWSGLKAPLYLDGYFRDSVGMMRETFRETFCHLQPGKEAAEAAEREISPDKIYCAVHVRRGDLARFNPVYGEPTPVEYFKEAIDKVEHSDEGCDEYLVFSDEPEWCISHIMGLFPTGRARLMKANGSDKGYIDLWLISRCRHIITSQGSMGKYGALLRADKDHAGLVVLPREERNRIWPEVFQNCVEI
ncbi:MAG: alpha-1,2-fucosyltransferase [Muribaculaceae bacterium]|nr:alpha-1,2-fucosyltransferase [Muribaculaceae bacterium]